MVEKEINAVNSEWLLRRQSEAFIRQRTAAMTGNPNHPKTLLGVGNKETLSSETFKIYSSDDIQGVELAGALKNIYAIICGIAESLKVGENAVGLILTRSMAEMSRFAVAKGANPITFLGLAGMGDLVATCTSNLSRNFQLGMHLGNGLKLDEAKLKVGQVAEGIRTLEVIKTESASLNISMPLVDSLYNIVFNDASSKTFIDDLVNNPHEVDVEFTY